MYGSLIKAWPDTVLVMDLQGTVVEVSEQALTLFRCRDAGEIVGMKICDHLDREYRDLARQCLEEVCGGEVVEEQQFRFVRKDGTRFIGEVCAALAGSSGDDSPGVVICSVRDVTRRVVAEATIRESEERFRSLFEGSLDAVLIADPESGVILDANPAASDLLMLSPESIISMPQWALHPEEVQEDERLQFADYTRDAAQLHPLEKIVVRSDGKHVHVEFLAQIIQLEGVPVLYSTFREITERKKVENELAKIERLESLGVLAGGIAHDFNNILTAISTNLSMAQMFGELSEEIAKMLGDAETATTRAKSLTQQLLTFSKGGAPVKKPTSVIRLLQETAEFALSGSNVSCEYAFPDSLPAIDADSGQISQVIQNLIINADQAMPEGGTIRIAVAAVDVREGEISPLRKGPYVRITVDDMGTGIPEKHLNRVFDPFFSTKQRGSGLGLSTAFSIVKNHGGHILVDSTMGRGTSFSVYLPTADQSADTENLPAAGPPSPGGSILLIDDDEMVRRSSGKVLKRLGYSVAFADEGAQGVELYRRALEGGSAFDAVILDVTIPGGMGGGEAMVELLKIDPDATVIVSSGYSNDPLMAHHQEFGFRGVIQKPYSLEELGKTVADAIRSGAG